eukprot:s3214_g6.t1
MNGLESESPKLIGSFEIAHQTPCTQVHHLTWSKQYGTDKGAKERAQEASKAIEAEKDQELAAKQKS